MKKRPNQQVSPKIAAGLIIVTLIIIQVVWWKGLIVREKPGPMRGGGGGGGGGPAAVLLLGNEAIRVETFAGATEPGDSDGAGYKARFDSPTGLALDSQGNLYVADSRNHKIKRITPQGKTTTLAGSGIGYADGSAQTAKFNLPSGVAVTPDGTVFVADSGNNRIRKIKDGQVTTLAGSTAGLMDGVGEKAQFRTPCGISYSPTTKLLYVSDTMNRQVRTLDLTGKVSGGWQTTTHPTGVLAGSQIVTAVPDSGLIVQGGTTLSNIPIDTQGKETKQSDFLISHPVALCSATDGWFVTDSVHHAVFFVKSGKAEVVAGQCKAGGVVDGWHDGKGNHCTFGSLSGVVWDGKSRVYVSDTSNNMIRFLEFKSQ